MSLHSAATGSWFPELQKDLRFASSVSYTHLDQDRNRKLPNAVWKRAVAGWGKFDDHTGDLEKDIPDASI